MGRKRLAATASRGIEPSLEWWPDWSGQVALIVASGPSAKEQPLEVAKGKVKAIAVNESWRLIPWADVLFGVDLDWWRARKGVPEFQGFKIGQNLRHQGAQWGIREVTLSPQCHEILIEQKGILGKSNSGFAAINLATQFGAKKQIWVGFDCSLGDDIHWHGKHESPLRNPGAQTAARWAERIDAQADRLKELGVQAFNCSPVSALKNYPKGTLEEALHACGALGQAHSDRTKNNRSGCRGTADRDVDSIGADQTCCVC